MKITRRQLKKLISEMMNTRREPVQAGRSKIHGMGLMVTQPLEAHEAIVLAADLDTKVTPHGELINHQSKASCKLQQEPDGYWVMSLRPMETGDEITIDYKSLPKGFIRDVTGFRELE